MPNQPKTPVWSYRAERDLVEAAKRKAKREGTSLSEIIRIRLEEYVYDEAWPPRDALPGVYDTEEVVHDDEDHDGEED